MMDTGLVLFTSIAYLALLFAIAYVVDRTKERGHGSTLVYVLSIAVYCTSWTFYGSVGRATTSGLGFLPIYLGPTLACCLGWLVLRRILIVAKANRITSIADFIASRYGKNPVIAVLVTVIAVIGSVPYIALQLKAVSTSFSILVAAPNQLDSFLPLPPVLLDTALWSALLLAVFTILFGTRHLDASEHHRGMVAAIAFESVVKLATLTAVGLFAVFGLFGGFGDLFERALETPALEQLFHLDGIEHGANWAGMIFLALAAAICLPRQFQVWVIENRDLRHLDRALWGFPVYLFAINLFVLPIALAGLLTLPRGSDPDLFVLTVPLAGGASGLALAAFIGGLSAATGMVIVETVALSTMVSNDLIMPVLLRLKAMRIAQRADVTSLLLSIRRIAIIVIVMLGYLYMRQVGNAYALVAIGLVSFAAVAQFFPAILLGLFWPRANARGAIVGITGGFVVWLYTLLLPSFAQSGWLAQSFITEGLFGLWLLKPYALLGLDGLDPVTHSLFWSMLINIGGIVGISLSTRQSGLERAQAALFTESGALQGGAVRLWQGKAPLKELRALVGRFIGIERAEAAFADHLRRRRLDPAGPTADAELVRHAERLLAGAIGSASARVIIATVAEEQPLGLDDVMRILEETSQAIEYSRRLEEKSRELEAATNELRVANERLKELDRLKDDFVSTVSHELRTPLTSIRSFSEILHDHPELDDGQRRQFLAIVIKESERLTRLINELLDLAKIEAGGLDWQMARVDAAELVREAAQSIGQLFRDKGVVLELDLPDNPLPVEGDRDRLMQVLMNLLSNAVKFSPAGRGRVLLAADRVGTQVEIVVSDNGPGIAARDQHVIFERFRQVGDTLTGKPQGTGLGLAISRMIVEHHRGRIRVVSGTPGEGATFRVTLPLRPEVIAAVP
ncbi:MAG: histidine kinase [Alphaproteobacteria bacterium]|jgi:Na+/proline symporter/nitrogen-specific signal transduction histidine kinase|nr:histidine kinase [Alphaproteobacteria bacterium]